MVYMILLYPTNNSERYFAKMFWAKIALMLLEVLFNRHFCEVYKIYLSNSHSQQLCRRSISLSLDNVTFCVRVFMWYFAFPWFTRVGKNVCYPFFFIYTCFFISSHLYIRNSNLSVLWWYFNWLHIFFQIHCFIYGMY